MSIDLGKISVTPKGVYIGVYQQQVFIHSIGQPKEICIIHMG